MRKFILLSLFVVCIISSTNAQSSHRNNSHYDRKNYGPALIAGGVIFTIAGFTTSPDWQYSNVSSSTIPGNSYQATVQNKPFFTNSPRTMIICTGATLTIVGLISLISER